jgi:acyl dehydratase
LLLIAYAAGLLDRLGISSGTAVAQLGIKEWRYDAPVFINDTIKVRMKIVGLRATSDGKRGIVDREWAIVNQRDETVAHGIVSVMLRRRPQA